MYRIKPLYSTQCFITTNRALGGALRDEVIGLVGQNIVQEKVSFGTQYPTLTSKMIVSILTTRCLLYTNDHVSFKCRLCLNRIITWNSVVLGTSLLCREGLRSDGGGQKNALYDILSATSMQGYACMIAYRRHQCRDTRCMISYRRHQCRDMHCMISLVIQCRNMQRQGKAPYDLISATSKRGYARIVKCTV